MAIGPKLLYFSPLSQNILKWQFNEICLYFFLEQNPLNRQNGFENNLSFTEIFTKYNNELTLANTAQSQYKKGSGISYLIARTLINPRKRDI